MQITKKNIWWVVGGELIILVVVFYVGMQVGGKNSPSAVKFGQQMGGVGIGQPQRNMARNSFQSGEGVINGTVINKDATSITVQLRDGGSKIIFVSEKTSITKPTSAPLTDVLTGGQVMIVGTANPDGSVTAQSIQIRPLDENKK